MLNNLAAEFSKFLAGKTVVVDTSSLLLAGTNLLTILPQCKLVIPSIVVQELEEKRAHTTVGFLAREWLRLLEELRLEYDKELRDGVPASSKYPYVSIRVEPNNTKQGKLPEHLRNGSHDSTILAVAKNLSENLDVVLLSNDAPMRLKATLDLELPAVEFNASKALAVQPFDGRYSVSISNEDYVKSDQVSKEEGAVPFETVVGKNLPKDMSARALVSVHFEDNEEKSLSELMYSNGDLRTLERKPRVSNVTARTVEQEAAVSYLRMSPEELPIVSLGGGAGTGKTLLSVAVGLDELENKNYQKVVVFRSLHEMGRGQELGFLPGDLKDKMEVWAGAVYDALDFIAGSKRGSSLDMKALRNKIEISPITYLRGRSLSNSYIILEEAQNFSRSEILNIMSRAGEGTKLVLTSDPNQVDNKFLQSGSNADIWSVIDNLKGEDIFAHITLKKTERSRVAAITSTLLAS